ncbi:MAG: hypothetical protein M0R46_13935 [Candidatus Muirbacterium halophilum]|nr:hypothetical protein [Candidatus Muirbacterium halophilum]
MKNVKNDMEKTTVFDYLIEEKILTRSEFRDLFSVRAIKLNDELLFDSKEEVKEGSKITLGFNDILVV